jgi:outer membrane protein OmpA-like peptidoglycan-associated protein
MAPLRKGPKIFLTLIAFVAIFYGGQWAMANGYVPTPNILKARIIQTDASVAKMEDSRGSSNVTKLSLPSSSSANLTGSRVKAEVWAWNAQIGCLYAIGGTRTTRGSLFEKHGVNATVVRQDNTDQMAADLATYAKQYSANNKDPQDGVNMVMIMGSQAGGFLQGLNTLLAEVGDEAQVVHVCGRSDGEDAVMGPKAWKDDPKKMIGSAIAVSIYEGDADMLKKYVKDGGVPFNPDPTTYDPNAVNVISAEDYVDAAKKYNANYCEDRTVVRNGVKTGKTQKVCVDGVATWTPADVQVAKGRGGLVRIISTHEYTGIMPDVVIVLKRWADDNRSTLVNAIKAFGEGGDQVLNYPDALNRACEISAQIYKEETGAYWCKYYRGTQEADAKGQQVQLGGSRASNLADNIRWFGLRSGMENIAGRTYTTFGKMLVELYPQKLSTFPPVEQAFNTSYEEEAIKSSSLTTSEAETRTFNPGAAGSRIAERSWHINFATGRSEINPAAERVLQELLNDLVISDNTAVEVNGHTDNVGNPSSNQTLSERRAESVKNWLESHASGNFPRGRLTAHGLGDTQPVESNDDERGRAQNRRVEIIQRRVQ